jgi:hypothetical protein
MKKIKQRNLLACIFHFSSIEIRNVQDFFLANIILKINLGFLRGEKMLKLNLNGYFLLLE